MAANGYIEGNNGYIARRIDTLLLKMDDYVIIQLTRLDIEALLNISQSLT